MPAPSVPTYSVAALSAAHTSFRDIIDGHATDPGLLRIRTSADALLAQIPLNDPCGTINGGTGQLIFTVAPVPTANASGDGTAAYGEFCDGAGVVHLAMACEAGTTPVAGKIVLQSLALVTGAPVELISATVG